MKKIALLLAMMIAGFVNAQTLDVSVIDDIVANNTNYFCAEVLVIHADASCYHATWYRPDYSEVLDGVFQLTVTENEHQGEWFYEDSNGANIWFEVYISVPNSLNPFDEPFVWKRPGDTITIGNPDLTYVNHHWSTGEESTTIDVVQDGPYSVVIDGPCGPETYTIQVCNNVEIYRAGVDPATNKNRVLWQTTPEQATYISSVKVERDGMVVGTVPYLDGQFLDNIGSENAARIYRITAIASDGTECPIPSYQFGTFNTIYSPDIANPNLMNFSWEDPFIEEGSPYEVIAYRIGRVDNSGEFIVIDQLSANVHLGKYDMDLFDGDYGIVAAVFNDSKRDYEELAFSNRSDNGIVGVGEKEASSFSVYPNPSNGIFTVEGASTLTIYNMMGQVIATSFDENGVHTISIVSPGVYFVKDGEGIVRKVVVK